MRSRRQSSPRFAPSRGPSSRIHPNPIVASSGPGDDRGQPSPVHRDPEENPTLSRQETYCDPILWAKTVAIFAVPPSTYVQGGTSGTSTPFLFMMDALLSRDQYGTYYGKYVRDEASRLLPPIHREFTRHVRKLPLKGYILGKMDFAPMQFERLATAYNRVVRPTPAMAASSTSTWPRCSTTSGSRPWSAGTSPRAATSAMSARRPGTRWRRS